ncbi:MAG TPA: glycosyltransferase family 2 protein, partial [Planctomycetota bacterium]|nr:glycosyltransferase family 2 protein [Planctomycetota bacterium]
MMDALIEIAFLVLGGALALVLIYYFALALASLLPDSRARRQIAASRGEMRFVVLVPAHDEEQLVGRTLESLSAIDYPRDRMSVVVIADNCSDGTEAIVRAAGRECWVRSDPERRGKGHALEWAFARLRKEDSFDAVVVIDADTLVDPQLLRVLEARFAAGAEAVQAYHDVHRPERTPMSSLTYLGVALSRNLKYPGRARLGSSANLLGNGMAFSRRVVAEVGWNAVSVAEDSEFQLELYMRGFRVAFAREARVA